MAPKNKATALIFPTVIERSYQVEKDGYTFLLDRSNVEKLKSLPDFEGKEEPAVVEEFLRVRVEGWAESLADAGALPARFSVHVDPHQRKTHLVRSTAVVVSTDI